MATFKVGQRVRIVRAVVNPALVGNEAIIVAITDGLKPYKLDVVGYGESHPRWICPHPGIWARVGWIEPLKPEGHQVVAWSECEWMPKHLREVA